MNTESVSILIPSYNSGKYISRMLNSILDQTYNNIQCIVVDDGSTDNTQNIIKEYENKFDRIGMSLVYLKKKNGGVASAINFGLKYIEGKYFTWADADDFYEKDAIENFLNCIIKNNCKVVRGNAKYVYSDRIVYKEQEYHEDILDDYLMYREQTIPCYPGIIFADFDYFVKQNKGKEINQREVGQNLQLIIPLSYHTKVFCMQEYVYNYVVRDDSHSRKKRNIIKQVHRMYSARCLRLETIKKVMDREDYKKYRKIIERLFLKREAQLLYRKTIKRLISKITNKNKE